MEQLLTHAQAANVLICLVLALHLLFIDAKIKLPAQLLGINYLLYGCQSLLLIGIISGQATEISSIIRPSTAMLLGPIFYLYFTSIKRNDSKLKAIDLLHITPCLLVLFAFIFESKYRAFTDHIIITSFITYFLLMIFPMLRGKEIFAHLGEQAQRPYRWLQVLAAMMAINIAIEIAIFIETSSGKGLRQSVTLFIGTNIFVLLNTIVAFFVLRRSPLIEWMYELGLHKITEGKSPTPEDKQIFEKWEILVIKDVLFKQEFGIPLSEAAKKLKIPARKLSAAINTVYGASYSQYLNDKRVHEAQRLIKLNPKMSLLDVMYESGFSTKSHFNKEFRRVLGKSPSQYRTDNQHLGSAKQE